MRLFLKRSLVALSVAGMLATAQATFAQSVGGAPQDGSQPETPAPKAAAESVSPSTTTYPVDIERIQELVQRQPAVKLDNSQMRFYVLVLAKQEDFVQKFAKNYDFINGPTKRGAAMTNSEFLSMSTPRALNELLSSTSGSSFAM